MILSALLLCLLSLASTAAADLYDYGFDISQTLAQSRLQTRAAASPYVVGTLQSRNRTAVRQELRQLELDTEMWTLYLLGLNLLQYTDQSEMLSYYQIAGKSPPAQSSDADQQLTATGIHGVPWIEWDGVAATAGNEDSGYCTHSSILFLPWHRPYLALYEQVLYGLVQYIASLYPDNSTRATYEAAATNFRIPYMDWAAQPPSGESVLPSSVGGAANVNVTGPNGVQEISNPLYTYLFKPLNATVFIEDPYDLWLTSVRSPTADNSSAGSNNTAVSLALNSDFQSIQQRLYNLLSTYGNYTQFSNKAWIPSDSGNYDSLESLHDTLHSLMGLGGHMAWIPFSSFDPIFFLHHCMIDRVFALWQILYPDAWIEPAAATSNTFTISIGETLDGQTALTPFYAGQNGTFWTSDAARDLSVFGYTYDDMADFPTASLIAANATTQAKVKALINRLYGTTSTALLGVLADADAGTTKRAKRTRQSWTGPRQAHHIGWQVRNTTVKKEPDVTLATWTPPRSPPRTLLVDGQYREWVANIHTEKQTLGVSFFVHLFLGDPPTDAAEWVHASSLVGSMGVFAAPGGAGAGSSSSEVAGTVPLTAALAQAVGSGALDSLDPDAVVPYLVQNLQATVATTDGMAVAAADVGGLGITVVSAVVTVPASLDEFPRWGDMEEYLTLI